MADNNDAEAEEAESNDFSINLDDLSDEEKALIANNPEVRKTLVYGKQELPALAEEMQEMLDNEECADLLIKGIADRRGRITESTTRKVLTGFVDEVSDSTTGE